jgi:phosphoglycolate phosphatase-like HAD superfamily hydrolase
MSRYRAVIFDVDGTLVDTNDLHAESWVETFSEFGFRVPFERVRRMIGMGGDKLIPAASGLRDDDPRVERIADRRAEAFLARGLARARALPGSRDEVVLVGDTPYDLEAAARAGIDAIAFRSGGWDDAALARAIAIFDGPEHLLAELDRLPLLTRSSRWREDSTPR